jgi:hypothetical protein
MHHFLVFQIDHANRVVGEFGDKEPTARHVNRHMIDPSNDPTERYLGL